VGIYRWKIAKKQVSNSYMGGATAPTWRSEEAG
jgi:hypothetical protein